jgi:hypothetical protein
VAEGGMTDKPHNSLFEPTPEEDEAKLRPALQDRPEDPAGTKPRHDPETLLPKSHEPLLRASTDRAPGDVDENAMEDGALAASGAETSEHAPHAARFQFVYGVLIGVGIAALVAAVIAFSGGNKSQTIELSTWSAWHPTRGAGDPIQQIVDHVAPEYRLASGKQAVAVTGGPSQIEGIPLVVALRSDPAHNGDVSILDNKNVVLYRMCGLGKNCMIKEGKPSRERGLLMRREALELALYTFNYVADIDAVTVLMPPAADPKTKKLSHVALLFRPQDVQPSLQNPLVDTLPGPTPNVKTLMRSRNLPVIDSITRPLQFDFSVTQDNANNRGYLVLDTIK